MVERIAPKKKLELPPPGLATTRGPSQEQIDESLKKNPDLLGKRHTEDGPIRQGADPNQGYGKRSEVFQLRDRPTVPVYARKKRLADCTVIRFFVGSFQIAYAKQDGQGFTLWNVGPDPAAGMHFKLEDDMHEALRRMLME